MTALESILKNLDKIVNELYNEFGTDIYNIRCELHDIKEELKAINYTHCCESDSEQLLCGVCDKETKHDTTLRDELHCLKCGNVAKE